MEFRQLRYFVQVAKELHFGQAAESLGITQPALSKQIRVLEQKLGIKLFIRTKRRVQLTKAGEVFLIQSQRLLQQADTAVRLAKDAALGKIGKLKIGHTATATYTILPNLVRRFRASYPQVEIDMLELSTEAQVTALNRGDIDVGFLHPPIDSRGLTLYPILAEELMIVLPKQHALTIRESLSFADLASESFILHPRGEGPFLYDEFLKLCRQAGFEPKIVKEVDTHQGRIFFVAAGMGITFLPKSLQTSISLDLIYKPMRDLPIKLNFSAAWRSVISLPVLEEFLIILERVTSEEQKL